jgi:hypothetical protein
MRDIILNGGNRSSGCEGSQAVPARPSAKGRKVRRSEKEVQT